MIQQVAGDGYTLQGNATVILQHNGAADQGVIEAPSLVKHGAPPTYLLFFSGGCFTTPRYNVQYATSASLLGPYTRAKVPLFETGTGRQGLRAPGGASVYRDGKHLLFHADWKGGRALYEAAITIEGAEVTA
ncbi:hypothetical protein LTR53_003152 [Teratosphaeriaceae sp. CCFEE 6253]|nr:hypothetical protein LTR53_003152 [Teratosphaeriaceae sp. CCFEE 6253]